MSIENSVACPTQIPLNDARKEMILSLVCDGVTRYANDIMSPHPLRFHASFPRLQRDCFLTNVWNEFELDELLKPYTFKRGGYDFVLLYQKIEGFMYILMKHSRLKQIKRATREEMRRHYIAVLSLFNNKYPHDVQVQVEGLEYADVSGEQMDILNKLIMEIDGEIKGFVVITYDMYGGEVVSAFAHMLTSNLELVREENWGEFLKAHYSTQPVTEEEAIDDSDVAPREHVELGDMPIRDENELVKLKKVPNPDE